MLLTCGAELEPGWPAGQQLRHLGHAQVAPPLVQQQGDTGCLQQSVRFHQIELIGIFSYSYFAVLWIQLLWIDIQGNFINLREKK